jgi:hypothetical protein
MYIVFLSNRDLLILLQNVDNVTLLHACQKCDDMLIYRITSQFSNLAKTYFFEDMGRVGLISDENIFAAQERIALILSELMGNCQLKDWNSKYAA